MKKDQRVFIFDTTLRDGQQSPGAGMSFADNLTYAQYAHELGIDILEAGFPAASQHDFDIVHTIAQDMTQQQSDMTIAALCQLREQQVVTTMEALQPSLARGKARLHTYVPVDPNLMPHSLGKMAQDQPRIVADIYRFIKSATDAGFEAEFSPEGYSRMRHNFDFVTDTIRAAVSAGARVINCPDTIGGASRWQGDDYFVDSMQKHADIIAREFSEHEVIWSTHCHNDLGLALDNTMNAVFAGPARQIEGCINGVGERAGNVSLDQCIMLIDQFGQTAHPAYRFFTHAKLVQLNKISSFIAEKMLPRQPHWPITGDNAARHSSGGHTNAVLKNPTTYQPFDPARVGSKVSFVFGPLSGGNHAKAILENNGFYCPNAEKSAVAQAIKDRHAERRKGVTDAEFIASYQKYRAPIKAEKIHYSKDDNNNVTLHIQGSFFTETDLKVQFCSENSALSALDHAVSKHCASITIKDYRSNADAGNTTDSKCHSTVVVCVDGAENYVGKATDSDIIISAIKAYINAVNSAFVHKYYRKKDAFYQNAFLKDQEGIDA